jgi:hypothetical protein
MREYAVEPQKPICKVTKGECAWECKAKKPLTLNALDAWELYCACQTQWRTGFSGATGLDYASVLTVAERMDPPIVLTPRVFDLLRLIEAKRLVIWSDERKALEAKNKK